MQSYVPDRTLQVWEIVVAQITFVQRHSEYPNDYRIESVSGYYSTFPPECVVQEHRRHHRIFLSLSCAARKDIRYVNWAELVSNPIQALHVGDLRKDANVLHMRLVAGVPQVIPVEFICERDGRSLRKSLLVAMDRHNHKMSVGTQLGCKFS